MCGDACSCEVYRDRVRLLQDGAIWLPCDLRLVLGNRATDQNCARHIISDVTPLISPGGLADGRLSEALDAALDKSHWKAESERGCSRVPAWGERLRLRGLDREPNCEADPVAVRYFLWLSHQQLLCVQKGVRALSFSLFSYQCCKHKGSYWASWPQSYRKLNMLSVDHNKGFIYQVGYPDLVWLCCCFLH